MNVRVQMIDTETGEILGTKYSNYALNFNTKNDAGFVHIMNWIQSSVRGVRVAKHKGIELRVNFCEELQPEYLPFYQNSEQANEIAKSYVR